MNKAGGFITLHRQILDWEWYQSPSTKILFLHLLLIANFADTRFKGRIIKRGQIVTSLPSLSTGAGLTIQQTRTALSHLISTGEVTDEATSQYRIITVVKYDDYQTPTGELTDNQQANNRRSNRQLTDDLADNQQHHNNINNGTNKQTIPLSRNRARETFQPPTVDDVERYCDEKGIFGFDAEHFIDYYTARGWMIGKNKMKDWKAAIRTWIRNDNERRKKEEDKQNALEGLPF